MQQKRVLCKVCVDSHDCTSPDFVCWKCWRLGFLTLSPGNSVQGISGEKRSLENINPACEFSHWMPATSGNQLQNFIVDYLKDLSVDLADICLKGIYLNFPELTSYNVPIVIILPWITGSTLARSSKTTEKFFRISATIRISIFRDVWRKWRCTWNNWSFFLGYEWVGWRNDTPGIGRSVDIVFEFDRIRNFSAVHLHTNNLFSKEVQVINLS